MSKNKCEKDGVRKSPFDKHSKTNSSINGGKTSESLMKNIMHTYS